MTPKGNDNSISLFFAFFSVSSVSSVVLSSSICSKKSVGNLSLQGEGMLTTLLGGEACTERRSGSEAGEVITSVTRVSRRLEERVFALLARTANAHRSTANPFAIYFPSHLAAGE